MVWELTRTARAHPRTGDPAAPKWLKQSGVGAEPVAMGRMLDKLIAALAADVADVRSAVDEVVAELGVGSA